MISGVRKESSGARFRLCARLKFLAGLKMNWEEMQMMFPKKSYLEKVDYCPLIILCPCVEEGV
ncbi:hypothetical protein TIFTF001_003104 [Ficus carica]|uniref:Uncharacterized protein n=1 Tax=Ficus carica TaxID=3494 RepID=A0AA88CQQ0_FICCA|nr:hypothetical protein TIFTF001_003104 [Ficus carica]